MKVGIIGYKGFVGSAFYEVFSAGGQHEVVGIGRAGHAGLKGTEFDILINADGNSSKRLADEDPEADFEMNAASTVGFLQGIPCRHYVHLSTVEVYNDKSSRAATREDAVISPSSLSNYGFSKYCGELAARKHAKSWMILRLAGMVGRNMTKGPAYDILHGGRLFLSEKSRLHFMGTREVARIAMHLCGKGKWGEAYNVAGRGALELSEFAKIAGVKLSSSGKEKALFDISTEKLERETNVMSSEETVRAFAEEWKRGKQ
ncbi:MAG: NAD(P)-dependent oxidoreductase [Candidatus Micrarchaeota archaeon]|nr:NAD(P)-dependent oxidoreductase [Candidatus Micrarchaeota archaeon]